MRWQIAQFIFCDRTQTLTNAAHVQQLEPMMAELLRYFCQHADQIITKDTLIEKVWLGRIVTDNAVSKIVTKLRKALADDAKSPQFIATFPKKGYKFIADPQPIVEIKSANTDHEKAHPATPHIARNSWLTLVLFFVFVSVIISVVYAYLQPNADHEKTYTSSNAIALTRHSGRESQPVMSPNSQYLSFVEVKNNTMHLWLKSLQTEETIEIVTDNDLKTWSGPAAWNKTGNKLVYLVTTNQSCQYFIVNVNGLTLSEPQLVHNCPAGSYGKVIFSHDDNSLIYSEAEGANAPYSIFELNLTTNKKRRVAQPVHYLGGNSQFDLHPTENKLLISSPDAQQWEGFYQLNIDTDQLTLLFKLDAYICCGIWSHDGNRVVMMGEHPSNQLVSYNLQGKDKQVVFTNSQTVGAPHRHPNGKDYLFSSGAVNDDLYLYQVEQRQNIPLITTSVKDKLAVMANHADIMAYISLASGSEDIWLYNLATKKTRKLTQFNDDRHYVDLVWSHDGTQLLALTLNELHLINAKTGSYRRLNIPQTEIRAVSFKSNHRIAFSLMKQKNWQLYYYDIKSNELIEATAQWQYAKFTATQDNTIWVDKQGQIFSGEAMQLIDFSLSSRHLVNQRKLNLQRYNNQLYWQTFQGKYQLQMINIDQPSEMSTLLSSDSSNFQVTHHGIINQKLINRDIDIYQTQMN